MFDSSSGPILGVRPFASRLAPWLALAVVLAGCPASTGDDDDSAADLDEACSAYDPDDEQECWSHAREYELGQCVCDSTDVELCSNEYWRPLSCDTLCERAALGPSTGCVPHLLCLCEGGPEVPETCGDGEVQAGEECDEGEDNSVNGVCLPTCLENVCGDAYLGPHETCDHGIFNGQDGHCTDTCDEEITG